ncbi:MAG: hypothetical protein WC565_04800 [Parcubacteria group bacterium]
MKSGSFRKYNFWFLIERACDVPSQWVAHCLELDVVTQGNDLDHACKMLLEACAMVLLDDIEARRDISERRAPDEFWDRLWGVVRHGKQGSWEEISKALQGRDGAAAGQMTFMVPVTKEADLLEHPERNVTVPVAFSNPRGHWLSQRLLRGLRVSRDWTLRSWLVARWLERVLAAPGRSERSWSVWHRYPAPAVWERSGGSPSPAPGLRGSARGRRAEDESP